MKIGIFDSGVGGIIIGRAIRERLPQYDYLYFGDTLHMPYGEKTVEEIVAYTIQGVSYLWDHECDLVIVACNTASAQAVRKIQREFLPQHYPIKKVLGVIVPVIEDLGNKKNIGILATRATVASKSFTTEIQKLFPTIQVTEQMAPELATLIEDGNITEAELIAKKYLDMLLEKNIDTLVLGCTHYPLIRDFFERELYGKNIAIISQDQIVPKKLAKYLINHPEIETRLSRGKSFDIHLTKINPHIELLEQTWMLGK
jgi:glutamate racemase